MSDDDSIAETIAERMAHAARELQDKYDPTSTMQSAVDLLVRNVPGCDAASVSLVYGTGNKRRVETPAASSELASANDQLQEGFHEGPCFDAIWVEETVYVADLCVDERWPTWGPAAAEATGARSVMTYRLFTLKEVLGALSIYSKEVDAFDAVAKAEGMALAAHIAIAVAGSLKINEYAEALDSRTIIAQACGIAMERYNVDAGRAFAMLTRLATDRNIKLREVAADVVRNRGRTRPRVQQDVSPRGGAAGVRAASRGAVPR